MTTEASICELCGEPMPPGQEMFKYHGYDGSPCPKPPLLQPWQQRVVEEKRQLDEKFSKLADFIQSPAIFTLDEANQGLLKRQQSIMAQYSEVLAARIKIFKRENH